VKIKRQEGEKKRKSRYEEGEDNTELRPGYVKVQGR
jgi:hypothetical protein